jgi:hypothetical protein
LCRSSTSVMSRDHSGRLEGSCKDFVDLDDLDTAITLSTTELDQLPRSVDGSAAFGSSGHSDPSTSLGVEESLVSEDVHCANRSGRDPLRR